MTIQDPSLIQPPISQGLYRSDHEHDACGVGMICDLNHQKSHQLIQDALRILVDLTHRGACGCDESTGDGAGILIPKPHLFLQAVFQEAHIDLPHEEEYAAGLVFLPSDKERRMEAQQVLAAAVVQQGLKFLG